MPPPVSVDAPLEFEFSNIPAIPDFCSLLGNSSPDVTSSATPVLANVSWNSSIVWPACSSTVDGNQPTTNIPHPALDFSESFTPPPRLSLNPSSNMIWILLLMQAISTPGWDAAVLQTAQNFDFPNGLFDISLNPSSESYFDIQTTPATTIVGSDWRPSKANWRNWKPG
ncbi:hypothetical protein FA15DRAFT_37064 [Coprinopsis marcescibilis]|uniref:Uncharacterized protein n=1 Tax=Coprinopsis marcescibilis TaxID=230819 RepID=A0A5C3LCT4_COPMA|nr:hypothetical protein FA15DRAFT_37064 [Coprinopsis marcescibilis]